MGGGVFEIANDFNDLLREDIYQVVLGCYKQEYPLIMKDVRHAKIAAWWDRAVDIIPANGGKGAADEVRGHVAQNGGITIAWSMGSYSGYEKYYRRMLWTNS